MRTLETLLGILTLLAPALAQEQDAKKEQPETWTFRGRAIDETGKPIEGACVSFGAEYEVSSQRVLDDPLARTDSKGQFEFSWSMPEGEETRLIWQTLIIAPGRASASPFPGGTVYFIGPNRNPMTVDYGDVVLPLAIVLSGRVHRENGRPLAGTKIVAVDVLSSIGRQSGWGRTRTNYISVAFSDEQGAFTLPGCFASGAALVISHEGYLMREVSLVTPRDPLLIEMHESSVAEGIVLGEDGKPCEATVFVEYEVGGSRQTHSVAADGEFRVDLARKNRYRLSAMMPRPGSFENAARSQVLDGPTKDIVLSFAVKKNRTPLILKAVAANSGKPVHGGRAAVMWIDPSLLETSRPYVEGMFDSKAKEIGEDGVVHLPGPTGEEPETGVVIIKANGYAPKLIEDVNWSNGKPPRLTAQLQPEAIVTGVVVDEDRKPVVGAVIVLAKKLKDVEDSELSNLIISAASSGQVSDAKGEFRIAGLGDGIYKARAYSSGKPCSTDTSIIAVKGMTSKVELMLLSSRSLSGRFTGASIGDGWRLEAKPQQIGTDSSWVSFATNLMIRRSAINQDGSFSLADLSANTYDLTLVIPQAHGRSPDLKIALDSIEIREGDTTQDIDLSTKMPAVIEGRVNLTGVPFRPEKLIVVAVAKEGLSSWGWDAKDAIALVSPKGRYQLPVAAGSYALRILDLETNIILHQSESLSNYQAGKNYQTNFSLELSRVRINLVPEKDGGVIALSRLEVIVGHPNLEADRVFFSSEYIRETEIGVKLADGRREITLHLPLMETTFKLRSEFHNLLNRAGRWEQAEPILELKFTPAAGTSNRLTIQVPPPQQVGKQPQPK